jgi:hypothetical protein
VSYLSNKVADKARHAAQRDLRDMFPGRWYIYKNQAMHGLAAEISDRDELVGKARNQANARLREEHYGIYRVLVDSWRAYYQKELGYEDLRPAANRSRRG